MTRRRSTRDRLVAGAGALAALCYGLAAASAGAQGAAQRNAAETEAAATWAHKMWREAHDYARKNAAKARALSAKAEEALAAARTAREEAERALSEARARIEAARSKKAALEGRIEATRARAARLRADLAFLADEAGTIVAAVDAAVRGRIGAEMRAEAAAARARAAKTVSSARAELAAALGREAVADVTELVTKDADSLRRLAYTLALRDASPRYARAATAYAAALAALGTSPGRVAELASRARALVDAAAPSASVVRGLLERALVASCAAGARALWRATARPRLVPASLGAEPKGAIALAESTGALAALEALPLLAPPRRAELARHVDLGPAKERLDGAVDGALSALRARSAAWNGGLDMLVEAAREVSR